MCSFYGWCNLKYLLQALDPAILSKIDSDRVYKEFEPNAGLLSLLSGMPI